MEQDNPVLAESYMRAHLKAAQFLSERGWNDDEVLEVVAEWTGQD